MVAESTCSVQRIRNAAQEHSRGTRARGTRALRWAATLVLVLMACSAAVAPASGQQDARPASLADSLASEGWSLLTANRPKLAAVAFEKALSAGGSRTDRSRDDEGASRARAARGLVLCQALLGEEDLALEQLRRMISSGLRGDPEDYLLASALGDLSSVTVIDSRTWISYFEALARVRDLSLGERRLVEHRLMLTRLWAGGDVKGGRRLSEQLHYITAWSFLGPFENAAGSGHGRLAVSPDKPGAGEQFRGKSGIRFGWTTPSQSYRPVDGTFRPTNYFALGGGVTGYAIAAVSVPRITECVFSITHGGAISVYLNGSLLYACETYSDRAEWAHVLAPLVPGDNQLFIEASGLDSSPHFAIGVSRSDGGEVKDLEASASVCLPAAVPDSLRLVTTMDVPVLSTTQRAWEEDPDNAERAFWYLIALKQIAGEEEIREALTRMANRRESASIAGQPGDLETVPDLLQKPIEPWPRAALLRIALALLYEEIQEKERARAAWRAATDLAPEFIPAQASLIEELIDQGRHAAAQTLIDDVRAQAPRSVQLRRLALKLASESGRRPLVLREGTALVSSHPELVDPYLPLSSYYFEQGDAERGERFRQAWFKRIPRLAAVAMLESETLERRDYGEALRLAREMCDLAPDFPAHWARREFLEIMTGNRRDTDRLEAALESFPYSTDLLEHLAKIHDGLGNDDAARTLYQRLVEIDPADFETLNALRAATGKPPIEEIVPVPRMEDHIVSDTVLAACEPGTDAVILADIERRVVFGNGANLRICYFLAKIVTENAINRFGRQGIEGGPGVGSFDLKEARTIKPNGRAVEAAVEGWVVGFQSLAPGDLIELSYTTSSFYPGALACDYWDDHYFQWDEPCLLSIYELVTPPDILFTSSVHNDPSGLVQYAVSSVEDFDRHTWKASNMPAYWAEALAPPASERAPWLDISTIPDWEAVGAWYADLVRWPSAVTLQVRAAAEEVTSGCESPLEEAARLFGFVRDEIEYDDVVFSAGPQVPRRAADVLVSQYGDCKDACALLAALLAARGIPASFVLSESDNGRIPFLPSPRFSHVIVEAEIDSQRIYMDPTRKFGFFDPDYLPPEETWALPIRSGTDLIRWSWDLPDGAVDTIRVTGRLDPTGALEAEVRTTLRDPRRVEELRAEAEVLCAKDRWEFLQMKVARGMAGRVVADLTWDDGGMDDPAAAFVYTLRQDAAGFSPNGHCTVRFLDLGVIAEDLTTWSSFAARQDDLLLGQAARDICQEIEIDLPSGLSVLDLPLDLELSAEGVRYQRRLRVEGGKLICRRRLGVEGGRVAPAAYPAFKETLDRALSDGRQGVVLRRR